MKKSISVLSLLVLLLALAFLVMLRIQGLPASNEKAPVNGAETSESAEPAVTAPVETDAVNLPVPADENGSHNRLLERDAAEAVDALLPGGDDHAVLRRNAVRAPVAGDERFEVQAAAFEKEVVVKGDVAAIQIPLQRQRHSI